MKQKRDYVINGVTFSARSLRTAKRRARGYERGELNQDGSTILAERRTPPGKPLAKRKKEAEAWLKKNKKDS